MESGGIRAEGYEGNQEGCYACRLLILPARFSVLAAISPSRVEMNELRSPLTDLLFPFPVHDPVICYQRSKSIYFMLHMNKFLYENRRFISDIGKTLQIKRTFTKTFIQKGK